MNPFTALKKLSPFHFTSLFLFLRYCIVLYCIVLYCIVLYCIVLYYIVLYCVVLYCVVLYCIVCGTKLIQNPYVIGNVALLVFLPELCPSALPRLMEQDGLATIFTAR
jgi:hypothetical protein